MMNIKYILSCDWGTSSFRLRLISITTSKIIAEEKNNDGILWCFEKWKQTNESIDRVAFYMKFINEHIKKLQKNVSFSLQGIPLIISGMASSSIGILELPYKKTPVKIDGSDLIIKKIKNQKAGSKRETFIISGLTTGNDVLRGEETQLAGCDAAAETEQLFIFPGTHSKHIKIRRNRIIDFKTYMTGEFFSLLVEKSILAGGLKKIKEFSDPSHKRSFRKGIIFGLNNNLLHTSFLARTNYLYNKLTPQQNFFYLSGLIIGTELRDLPVKKSVKVWLVANGSLLPLYKEAIKVLNKKGDPILLKTVDADVALIKGHLNIFRSLINKNDQTLIR